MRRRDRADRGLSLRGPALELAPRRRSATAIPGADRLDRRDLRQHLDRDVSIGHLADRIGMSPRNFIRRFKAATGRLPGAYIQMLRVEAAKELLEQGAASIQVVCSKGGYEDIAFFRSLFKRHTDMTPAEYRNRFANMSFDRGELASGRAVA